MYLHWQLFFLTTWKRGMLQTLVSRAFKVCSNNQHLQNVIKHLKKVFRDINGDPNWIIEQTVEKVKNQNKMTRSTQVTTNAEHFKTVIPANNTCKIIYTGTKLASIFYIKDKISKEHKHDLIYKVQCPDLNC